MLVSHHELSDLLSILLLLDTQLFMLEDLPLIYILWSLIRDAILLINLCQQVSTQVLMRRYLTMLFDDRYTLTNWKMSHLSQCLKVAYPFYILL